MKYPELQLPESTLAEYAAAIRNHNRWERADAVIQALGTDRRAFFEADTDGTRLLATMQFVFEAAGDNPYAPQLSKRIWAGVRSCYEDANIDYGKIAPKVQPWFAKFRELMANTDDYSRRVEKWDDAGMKRADIKKHGVVSYYLNRLTEVLFEGG